MIFGDLVALAKAGYSPAQVKELLALSKEDAAPAEKPAEIPAEESRQPEPEKAAQAAEPKTSEENTNENLQKQIEALKTQLQKAQADLDIAQKANTSTPIKKEPEEDPLVDLVRSYM